MPNRRLGKERISVLVKDTESKNRSLWESIQALITGEIRFATNDKAAEMGLANFVRCINLSRQKLAKSELATVSDLIDYVRKNVQYDDYLRKKFGPEADERIGNLEELKTFSKEVEQVIEENKLPDIGVLEGVDVEENTLSRFLGNIALMTDVRDNGEDKVDCVCPWIISTNDRLLYRRYTLQRVKKMCFVILICRFGMAGRVCSGIISRINPSSQIRRYR